MAQVTARAGKKGGGGGGSTGGQAPAPKGAGKKKKAASSGGGSWMKSGMIVLASAALCLGGAACLWKMRAANDAAGVLELTDENLPKFLAETAEDGALINFYMSGCVHCKKLAPEFEAAAKILAEQGGHRLAAANIEKAPKAGEIFGVHRYPTMLWFKKARNVYEVSPADRTADKIVKFVEWVSQPALVDIDTLEELEAAIPQFRQTMQATGPPVVVAYGGPDASWRPFYELAAEKSRGKAVFIDLKAAVPQASDSAPFPSVRAYFSKAEDDKDYTGALEEDALHEWVSGVVTANKEKPSS